MAGPAMDARDFVAALRERWKTIALSTAVATGIGLAYLAMTPTAYTATVSILVDGRPRAPVGSEPGANINAQADTILVESQVKILSSNAVLKRAVQREGLADDPGYGGGGAGLRSRIMSLFGLGGPQQAVDKISAAVQALARSVVVKRSERTYVIDVDVSAGDPAKAARLANSVADAYLADQLDARATVARGDARWLDQRIGELQARVQDAENRVQAYRAKNAITDANGKSVGDQELADLANELTKARTRAVEANARFEKFKGVVNSARINELPADAAHAGVLDKLRGQLADLERQESNLRTTLGDRHPALREVESQLRDARGQVAAELKRLADASGVELQVARAAEKDMAARVEQARKATDGRNQSSVELRELERDVAASKAVYEKFLRARESNDSQNASGPDARVLAPATIPSAPSQPKTAAVLFASIASGLFIGVGLALFNDFLGLDGLAARRVEDEDAVEAEAEAPDARFPFFGRKKASAERKLDFLAFARSSIRQRADSVALREPRTTGGRRPRERDDDGSAELFDTIAGGRRDSANRPRVALVTSLDHRVGRAEMAVALARRAASRGMRALVIDADLERPSLIRSVPSDAKKCLIDLNGVTRPLHEAAPSLWFAPIAPNEERVVARIARRPDARRFPGIKGVFDFVAIAGPSLEFDAELADLAVAADKVVVVAVSGQRLPNPSDVADALGVGEDRIVGHVPAKASAREAA